MIRKLRIIEQLIDDELTDLESEEYELENQLNTTLKRLQKVRGRIVTLLKYGSE